MNWIYVAQDRYMLWWTFGLCKTQAISWLAKGQLASQEGVCSMELVTLLNNRREFAVHDIHNPKFYCCSY